MDLADASTQLLAQCQPHMARTQRPWRLALAGLPGSGKSTLARATVERARAAGWPALALSLDDFYWPRRARRQLARHIHPLLATRGVPGTHDLALLQHVLSALPRAATDNPVPVPRFDKGRDTRQAPSRWSRVKTMPRLLILEGWCLGIAPQPESALAEPINELERHEDPDASWRLRVNRQLPAYLQLWRGADNRAWVQVTSWSEVERYRARAEDTRHQRGEACAMQTPELTRFLQHYERLGRASLATPPTHADLAFPANELHGDCNTGSAQA